MSRDQISQPLAGGLSFLPWSARLYGVKRGQRENCLRDTARDKCHAAIGRL